MKFSGSDIAYFIALTLFQTGLPFFVKVSMKLDESWAMYFLGGMTVLSACFYPIVSKLVAKFGKKKLVITGFVGLALAYTVTALIGVIPGFEGMLPGILIVVISAFPMALLGIIPQSIIADVAEEDAILTGEKREGMFFAARTFAMKMGQSVAALVFTSLAILLPMRDMNIKIIGNTEVKVYQEGVEQKLDESEKPYTVVVEPEEAQAAVVVETKPESEERLYAKGTEIGSYEQVMYEEDFDIKVPEGKTYNVIPQGGRTIIAKDQAAADELKAKQQGTSDLTASRFGLRIVAIVAIVFCLLGAVILAFYKEKKVMGVIEEVHKKENLPE